MSPRAAWRLAAAGFDPVYDYTDGKADWLAADLPFEGAAQLVGQITRRQVPTATEDTPAADALGRLDAVGFGPVLVLNAVGVVLGTVRREQLAAAAPDTGVGSLMRFGITTVRPSEPVPELTRRMGQKSVTRIVVTRQDGTAVGLFFPADVQEAADPGDAGQGPARR